jgi:hypothetical protein
VENEDEALHALFQAYVACRLAVDALPDLPDEIRQAVREPITALCDAVAPVLERQHPGFLGG